MEGWGDLEADFARVYHLDLVEWLVSERPTFRRFLVMVRGLGQDSGWWARAQDNGWLTTPKAAEAAFHAW